MASRTSDGTSCSSIDSALSASSSKLTGERRGLADNVRDINAPGRKFLEERFEKLNGHLGHLEARLAEVERDLR